MRKLFLIFCLLICRLSMYAYGTQYILTFEGSEPSEKKYFFSIDKPKDFDASKIQYALWKLLKDKGYTLTDSINADIVIKVMPIVSGFIVPKLCTIIPNYCASISISTFS